MIDANVLFAALIRDSHTRRIILSTGWIFYVPEYLLMEFDKHIDKLMQKTHLPHIELRHLIDEFLTTANIRIIPFIEFRQFLQKAEEISPDPDDAHYFALAMKMHCGIWSNDNRLKNQSIVRIYSTKDLLSNLW